MTSRLGKAAGEGLQRRAALQRPASTPAPTAADTAGTMTGAVDATPRVPIDSISRHPLNPRGEVVATDDEAFTGLVDSIREAGIIQPVVVGSRAAFTAAHPEYAEDLADSVEWVLLAGERRLAAARALGLRAVPITQQDRLFDDGLDVETMIIENVQRESLTPMQEARAYALLAERGDSQRVIATRVGRSQSHIAKRLGLLKLPAVVLAAVEAGDLGVKEAETLAVSVPADAHLAIWKDATQRSAQPVELRWAITRWQADRDRQVAREAAEKKARAKAKRDKVDVIDPNTLPAGIWPSQIGYNPDAVERARAAGTLAGVINHGELILVDTSITQSAAEQQSKAVGERHVQEQKDQEQQRKAGMKARRAILPAMLSAKLSAVELAELLAFNVIRRATYESTKLAAQIAQHDSAESLAPQAWRDAALNGTSTERIAAARAIALADLEAEMASTWTSDPAPTFKYLELLGAVGYTEGPTETCKRQAAAERLNDPGAESGADDIDDEDLENDE